jgi:hypothetical protein
MHVCMDISDKESSKGKHTRHALMHAPALFVPCLPFCCCCIIAQLACASATLLLHAALCNLLAAACMQLVLAVSAREREPLLPCTPSNQSYCCMHCARQRPCALHCPRALALHCWDSLSSRPFTVHRGLALLGLTCCGRT